MVMGPWAVIWGDGISLLSLVCSADFMDTLCSGSISHHVKQVNFVVCFFEQDLHAVGLCYSKEPKSDCF